MGPRLNFESSSHSGTPDRDCFFPQLSLNLCNRSKMNANTPSVRANTRENIVSFPTHQKKRGGRKRMRIQRNQHFKKKNSSIVPPYSHLSTDFCTIRTLNSLSKRPSRPRFPPDPGWSTRFGLVVVSSSSSSSSSY